MLDNSADAGKQDIWKALTDHSPHACQSQLGDRSNLLVLVAPRLNTRRL